MKAWNVTKINELRGTIIFAETESQAKALALRSDALEDADYRDLRARRMPKIDDLADEPGECDWGDPKIIIALVLDYGWGCQEPDVATCESCPALKWCDWRVEQTLYEDEGGGEG